MYQLLDYFQYNESREKADHGYRNGPYVTKNKEKSQNLFLKNFTINAKFLESVQKYITEWYDLKTETTLWE